VPTKDGERFLVIVREQVKPSPTEREKASRGASLQ
jgi:hypothetical protein